ncbi:conjugal transfer transcriptional regulator TraJ [Serratia marcescens]|uniref:conjugal transfer transcriptional regulator TraJ n=1 Tax=Serratia marcescens TaxID=615 RepID=UPI002758B0B5|nr:conjugal transfer transcriptional regulator TraJ [Serratia marcescens]MDP8771907.1 conjugal transfer transcriptional regulator TraJ [Serratia marcescens]MDP8802311.1 conjugal transfer transcriptional regulator TraJ [Serratia marcescens]
MTKNNTRKDSTPIKVYCLPEEKSAIENNAKTTGLSTATFLRKVGLGYEVKGIVDLEQVQEMAKVNGDLGRLGGLLKLWLANDPRTDGIDPKLLTRLVDNIEDTRSDLRDKMSYILKKSQ